MKISVRVTKHERHLILGNEQGVVEREVGGGRGDWVMGAEGALDGMSTECYAKCWQIELQFKKIGKKKKRKEKQTPY